MTIKFDSKVKVGRLLSEAGGTYGDLRGKSRLVRSEARSDSHFYIERNTCMWTFSKQDVGLLLQESEQAVDSECETADVQYPGAQSSPFTSPGPRARWRSIS